MKGALLVAGTHSDAGKSVVDRRASAAGCARQGVRVAPFKAQNMALNSVVTPRRRRDRPRPGGAGRGRRARARGGDEPDPASSRRATRHSQVDRHGPARTPTSDARSYQELKHELRPVVASALADLRERFDVVVCEGAGSPAEINLRAADLTNMGLARAAGLPAIVVGDIDRGGVFASLFGTLALLERRATRRSSPAS